MKNSFLKVLSFLPLLLLLTSVIAFADGISPTVSEVSQMPEVSAQSYVLADARTGEVIFSQNENSRMPIASTTKIMTCLVALENGNLSDTVTVTADCCGIEGSSIYLYEGEKLSLEDLLYALMLESANDAAVCIAKHVGGSVEGFSEMMNKKASELGLVNSHFNNPHGLEDPQHYSTAYDMSLLWCEAMKNGDFKKIVASKTHKIDLDAEKEYRFLSNHNKLLKTYDFCVGGKTGFTKNAGRCLVSGAEYNGVELVMVTLNDANDWDDHVNLLDYAFSLYSSVNVASAGSISVDIPVVGGVKKSITVCNTDSLTLSLRDVTSLQTKVVSPGFIYAPVTEKNSPVATVVYMIDGKEIASLPLYPKTTVKQAEKQSLIKRLISIFK